MGDVTHAESDSLHLKKIKKSRIYKVEKVDSLCGMNYPKFEIRGKSFCISEMWLLRGAPAAGTDRE